MKRFLKQLIFISLLLFISCSGDGGGEETYTYTLPDCYMSADEINTFLDTMASDHSSICSVKTLGSSVTGREIRCLIISDNPDTIENEPTVRLTGGIHGSEPVSVDLMIRYIEYLTDSYGSDSNITNLINSRYIVIIPVLNPDGYMNGSRYNDNRIDLNRNFDSDYYEAGGSYGDYAFSEPESRLIRDMLPTRIIHSSLTFHSGEVVVNLPFDYDSENDGTTPAENDLVWHMGTAYSTAGTAPYRFCDNPDIYISDDSINGVVNGGNWYEITGSLQDWSYLEYGCLDLTIEVALYDPEDDAGLEEVFDYNRHAITAYITNSGYGVYGRVTNSSGDPISNVEVSITGGDLITHTDSQGYYFKILEGGDYSLNFDKTGYTSVTYPSVTVTSDGSTLQNVTMNLQ